jgi:hypothetical protein
VKDVAEVTINGESAGIAWKAPYRVDITHFLKTGENKVEVRVANLWVNRIIGDQQPGATRYAYAYSDPYKANAPLLPSGLLGPVLLVGEDTVP